MIKNMKNRLFVCVNYLTDKRASKAFFPAETIFRSSHHDKTTTHRDEYLNFRSFELIKTTHIIVITTPPQLQNTFYNWD